MWSRRVQAVLALVAGGCLAVSGCTTGVDKAGDAKPPATIVLHVLNTREPGEVQPFVEAVKRLSKGSLQLSVKHGWHKTLLSGEPDAIRAVRAGRTDLAVIPARDWHSLGVTSFDALVAPLTVDSLALQQKVLASEVPDDMLKGLSRLGLTGIGILPGPMRRPDGISRPLLGPADYRGARLGYSPSAVGDRSLRALGAVPVPTSFDGSPIDAFDGIELQVSGVAGNEYNAVRTITANVNLWPRTLVIVAGARAVHRLSAGQLAVLRTAARAALTPSTAWQIADDIEGTGPLCNSGTVDFASATSAQLGQLRAAVQPVIAWLRRDSATAHFLDRIAVLRHGVAPSARETLRCAHSPTTHIPTSTGSAVTALAGAYRMVLTHQEGLRTDPNIPSGNWGTFVFVFDRGRFAYTQENAEACGWGYGTFAVKGHLMEWIITDGGNIDPNGGRNRPGEDFTFSWSSYRGAVTLAAVPGAISPEIWTVNPMQRLQGRPWVRWLSRRCPPPAAAFDRH
jgi:TRAP-type transport system periplasmic protein